LRSDTHFATIVGDWEKPYGEFQFDEFAGEHSVIDGRGDL
jgi:hypothetical protein